jgi:hypothetical protein
MTTIAMIPVISTVRTFWPLTPWRASFVVFTGRGDVESELGLRTSMGGTPLLRLRVIVATESNAGLDAMVPESR